MIIAMKDLGYQENQLQTAKDLIHHADNKHAEQQGRITELEADNRHRAALEIDATATIAGLKERATELTVELDDWRNKEAYFCPEDVGFVEYIAKLVSNIDDHKRFIYRQADRLHDTKRENQKLLAELAKHEWVSVEDRLPEDNDNVLVLLEYETGQATLVGSYTESKPHNKWGTFAVSRSDCITHWKYISLPATTDTIKPATFLPKCIHKLPIGEQVMCSNPKIKHYKELCSKRCDCPEPKEVTE
jgi:hypothetical protein